MLLLTTDICPQFKAMHNTAKYAPDLRRSHEDKSIRQVLLMYFPLRVIIVDHDPLNLVFTRPFSS